MSNPIEENATKLLISLYENNPEQNLMFEGKDLEEFTNLDPKELNNAVDYLDDRGLIERQNYLGTAPYKFGHVHLNSRGNYLYHELQDAEDEPKEKQTEIVSKQPLAAGSPFGFTDYDWEYVQRESEKTNVVKVVLGYQFKSEHYNSDKLVKNIKNEFETAVETYNDKGGKPDIELNFKSLAAGYGEHLFNQIARDIISSDIAVFETSDQNANVMIEMGVALTWGKRVLPIKKEGQPKPPSDISGQTYADYKENGKDYTSNSHSQDLIAMIERGMQKKQRN